MIGSFIPRFKDIFFHRIHDETKMLYRGEKRWPSLLFLFVGVASIIWLLIRSARKPSRLSYPCQQAASANTVIFVSWVAAVFTGLFSRRFRKAGKLLLRSGLLFASLMFLYVASNTVYVYYNHLTFVPNAVGQSGSRVVWVKQSGAATGWSNGYGGRISASIADSMMDTAITQLTGQSSVKAAWSQLFKTHNGGADYQSGQTFAIKVNLNNMYENQINANPIVVNAVLRQLINEVGVPASNINVYDVSRGFPGGFSSAISSRFSGVKLNTDRSVCVSSGVGSTQLGCVLQNSTYLINMPLLKVHGDGVKISMSMKNHFGSSNSPNSFHGTMYTSAKSSSQIVINKQPVIKDKTILVIGDGIYGTKSGNEDANPSSSSTGILPYPESIFVSADPIALDSVMIDYIASQSGTKISGSNLSWVQTLYQNAAAEGLGTFDTSSDTGFDFKYTAINLVRCVNGSCSGGPPPTGVPTPTPTITPTSTPAQKPGDANGDGQVTGADFIIWIGKYGISTSQGYPDADFNLDGKVTGLDYIIWVNNYGS